AEAAQGPAGGGEVRGVKTGHVLAEGEGHQRAVVAVREAGVDDVHRDGRVGGVDGHGVAVAGARVAGQVRVSAGDADRAGGLDAVVGREGRRVAGAAAAEAAQGPAGGGEVRGVKT